MLSKITVFIFIFGALLSCQKQAPPSVDSKTVGRSEQRRLEACSQVSYLRNFLEHKNFLNFFICTEWDKTFPHLFSAMSEVEKRDWDHLLSPIDETFFDDWPRRDRFFRLVRELDRNNGLDDLADVMTALNETNFFDGINDLFQCAENPSLQKCEDREMILSKSEIDDLLSLFSLSAESLSAGTFSLEEFVAAISPLKEELRKNILLFYETPEFNNLRLRFIDALAKKLISGQSPADRNLVPNVLTARAENGEAFLKNWINSDEMSERLYIDLVTYFLGSGGNKDYLSIRGMKKAVDESLSCRFQEEGPSEISIDMKGATNKSLSYMLESEQYDFVEYMLDMVALTRIAGPFCPQLVSFEALIDNYETGEREKITTSPTRVFDSSLGLISEASYFDIIKLFVHSLDTEEQDYTYLLDLLDGESFYYGLQIISNIERNSPGFLTTFFAANKEFSSELYFKLGHLFRNIYEEIPENSLKALGKLWMFYDEEEKNFLFNFVDRHLREETDYIILFDFYAKLMKEFIPVSEDVFSRWVGDDLKKEKMFQAIKSLVATHSGGEVLGDLSRYFSRDYILQTIMILSRGLDPGGDRGRDYQNFNYDEYLRSVQNIEYYYQISPADARTSQLLMCSQALANKEKSFYELVHDFPQDCLGLRSQSIVVKAMDWIGTFASDYDDFIGTLNADRSNDEERSGAIVGKSGLFSPGVMDEFVRLTKIIDRHSNLSGGPGLTGFITTLRNYFFKDEEFGDDVNVGQDVVLRVLNLYERTFGRSDSNVKVFRNALLKYLVSNERAIELQHLTNQTADLLEEFRQWRVDRRRIDYGEQNDQFKCTSFLNTNIGSEVCPNRETVKEVSKRVLELLVRENEDAHKTGIGLLIEAATPGGIRIPYQAKSNEQRNKRLSLSETMEVMYEMSSPAHPANRKVVAYDDGRVESDQRMMTTERIETVIRNVWFDENYLGAHYQNSVSRAHDYNSVVRSRERLIRFCSSLRFCGKFLNGNKRRMASNAIESFGGLSDSNEVFGRGDYMMALQTVVTGSSSAKSSRDTIIEINFFGRRIPVPYIPRSKYLLEHNGEILYQLSRLGTFSQGGRVLHDRIGENIADFINFISREDVILASEHFFRGFEESDSEDVAVELINNILEVKDKNNDTLVDVAIDYLADLSYQEIRELEVTLGRVLSIVAHLGDPENITEYDFSENSLYSLFKSLSPFIEKWPLLKKVFSDHDDLMSMGEDGFIAFLHSKLYQEDFAARQETVSWINHIYELLNDILFLPNESALTGSEIIASFLDKSLSTDISLLIEKFLDLTQEMEREGDIDELLSLVSKTTLDESFSLVKTRHYLQMSTQYTVCHESGECYVNYHFDEPTNLIHYLLAPSHTSPEQTKFEHVSKLILKEEHDTITDFLDRVIPYMVLRENTYKYEN